MQREIKNKFVCLDDITHTVEDMNYVIYNPNTDSKEVRMEKISDVLLSRYHIRLNSVDLFKICSYEADQLNEFCEHIGRIIKKYKQ